MHKAKANNAIGAIPASRVNSDPIFNKLSQLLQQNQNHVKRQQQTRTLIVTASPAQAIRRWQLQPPYAFGRAQQVDCAPPQATKSACSFMKQQGDDQPKLRVSCRGLRQHRFGLACVDTRWRPTIMAIGIEEWRRTGLV